MKTSQKTILSYAGDLPNICSLIGLCCTLLAIYFSILGLFHAAMIGMIWAVFFDWSDGIIARKMKGRTEEQGLFGAQLDSLIDIVSFGVCPAVFLLSYGHFSAWYLPGAFLILATGVIRLSYFNVFGLVDKSTYLGLALDNNVLLLAVVFLFSPVMSQGAFSIVLYIVLIFLAVLNVAPIRTPKFTGKWYFALSGYTVLMSILFSWQWCTL
ncbi:phosphatidylcholine/phosphatidylserine synthase [Desulfogranum marinum]|uniref:CDP-alcohol phosphatidyltransferase family protein n=1 Tax=Desulfogranum marinum TaxID=453220 RepID=UPI001962720E|nr:CDP-alcohol phosphatidyltransferase family protein [Desulfogranum marinum]MBM9512219.1 CDP-alcohol phosphatidyltransferase family protein [Desulfogranum marinum]